MMLDRFQGAVARLHGDRAIIAGRRCRRHARWRRAFSCLPRQAERQPRDDLHQRRHLVPAAPDHVERHIKDDGKADEGDPAMLVQKPRDERCRNPHQRDGQDQPDDQHGRMLARSTRHGQHIVERHRHVGDDDLHRGLTEGLARRATRNRSVRIQVGVRQRLLRLHFCIAHGPRAVRATSSSRPKATGCPPQAAGP